MHRIKWNTRQRKKASRLIDRMAWRIEQIKIRICTDYVYDLSRWRMEFTRTEREATIISRDSRMNHGDDDKIKEGKRDEKGTKRSASKRASFTWFLWSLLGCTRTTRVMSNNAEVCCIHTSTVTFYPALLPLPWTIPMKLDVIYDFDRASNKRTSVERIFFLRISNSILSLEFYFGASFGPWLDERRRRMSGDRLESGNFPKPSLSRFSPPSKFQPFKIVLAKNYYAHGLNILLEFSYKGQSVYLILRNVRIFRESFIFSWKISYYFQYSF